MLSLIKIKYFVTWRTKFSWYQYRRNLRQVLWPMLVLEKIIIYTWPYQNINTKNLDTICMFVISYTIYLVFNVNLCYLEQPLRYSKSKDGYTYI